MLNEGLGQINGTVRYSRPIRWLYIHVHTSYKQRLHQL